MIIYSQSTSCSSGVVNAVPNELMLRSRASHVVVWLTKCSRKISQVCKPELPLSRERPKEG